MVLRMNRPERMNAMAFDVMIPVKEALEEISYDNDVRVVVITGSGGEAFCIDSPVLPDELELLPAVAQQAEFRVVGCLATHADWDHVLGRTIWPDAPLPVADTAFHRTLLGLRGSLRAGGFGDGSVEFHNGRYVLASGLISWADTWEVERMVKKRRTNDDRQAPLFWGLTPNQLVGHNLWRARKERGWTQAEAADDRRRSACSQPGCRCRRWARAR